ncbi:hypothetical protein [Microbacterium sp. NPDC089695]|uniref:hypothetical protein n=1 Tax=Microbacterium sp. NPDC089695 TaxID=3364198 RepID=UPI00382E2A3C
MAEMIDSLEPSGRTVASYVLNQHDAAVRVLNPAFLEDGTPVAWRNVGDTPIRYRSDLQWAELGIDRRSSLVTEPQTGGLDRGVASALLNILVDQNSSVEVSLWEGYGDMTGPAGRGSWTFPPDRVCSTWTATPNSILESVRIPVRWWDPELKWALGNDIYARSVFLSADVATIARVLSSPALEAFPVAFDDPVTPEDR